VIKADSTSCFSHRGLPVVVVCRAQPSWLRVVSYIYKTSKIFIYVNEVWLNYRRFLTPRTGIMFKTYGAVYSPLRKSEVDLRCGGARSLKIIKYKSVLKIKKNAVVNRKHDSRQTGKV